MKVLLAARVDWMEHERGWGYRPDGTSLHKDISAANNYMTSYWARQPKEVPDTYSRPGEPRLVSVTPEQYERLQREGFFWLSHSSHPPLPA